MSKVTEHASSPMTAAETITVELIETDLNIFASKGSLELGGYSMPADLGHPQPLMLPTLGAHATGARTPHWRGDLT